MQLTATASKAGLKVPISGSYREWGAKPYQRAQGSNPSASINFFQILRGWFKTAQAPLKTEATSEAHATALAQNWDAMSKITASNALSVPETHSSVRRRQRQEYQALVDRHAVYAQIYRGPGGR